MTQAEPSSYVNEVARWFDGAAKVYDIGVSEWRSRLIAKIVELSTSNRTHIVLDVGTGTGALTLAIARSVNRVVAIDVSKGILTVA